MSTFSTQSNRYISLSAAGFLIVLLLPGYSLADPAAQPASRCTPSWYQYVESLVPTGDGMGHGPDPGSDEWRSVIEFRLGIRGNPEIPDRSSEEWCKFIDGRIRQGDITAPSNPRNK